MNVVNRTHANNDPLCNLKRLHRCRVDQLHRAVQNEAFPPNTKAGVPN